VFLPLKVRVPYFSVQFKSKARFRPPELSSCEDRRLNQSRSTTVIPSWARREERLSRSEFNQPFRVDSDALLHMNLIPWIRFASCEVRRLNQAWIKASPLPLFPAEPIRIQSAVSNWFRRRTSHELNSLNSIRLKWSTASEPDLYQSRSTAVIPGWARCGRTAEPLRI